MPKRKKAKRRILKARISFLSLCPMGMNQIQTVYKADDGKDCNVSLATLIKGGMTEQGEILAVVYAPDMVDGEGDIASAQVIKEFAYDFAANGQGIDIRHNEEVLTNDDAFVAETFIVQKDDPRFTDTKDYDGNSVDVTGGWAVVIKVDNEELRKAYRDGEWGGISMGGLAMKQDVSKESGGMNKLCRLVADLIQMNNPLKKSETEMTDKEKKEMVELVKSTMATVDAEKKAEEIKKAEKKKADEPKLGMGLMKPVLKADPTDLEIDQHAKSLQIFELSEVVNTSDMDSVRKFQEYKQQIIEGKEVSVGKEKNAQPYNAFNTNQSSGEVQRGGSGGELSVADQILKEMDAEEKPEKNAA